LQELLKTPLFLAIAAAVYQGQAIRNQSELWDAYVESRLSLPLNALPRQIYQANALPTSRQTRYYLIFLAKQLRQTQIEFRIEQMQPTWFWTKAQRWCYRLVFRSRTPCPHRRR
jgi:hypothetical protein